MLSFYYYMLYEFSQCMNKNYIKQKGQSARETGFIGYTRNRAQVNKITHKTEH